MRISTILILIFFTRGCAAQPSDDIESLINKPLSLEQVHTQFLWRVLDTVVEPEGPVLIRVAPFICGGFKGTLSFEFYQDHLIALRWYEDSLGAWIIPPKGLDSTKLLEYHGSSREHFVHLKAMLEKAYGSAWQSSDEGRDKAEWGSDLQLQLDSNTNELLIHKAFQPSTHVTMPFELHSKSNVLDLLNTIGQTSAALRYRRTVADTSMRTPTGQFPTFRRFDTCCGIPGKTIFTLDHDSSVLILSWSPEDIAETPLNERRLRLAISDSLGEPIWHDAEVTAWDLENSNVLFSRNSTGVYLINLRKGAKHILGAE